MEREKPSEKLISICAWCYPLGTEPKLPEGQVYTHGICQMHKEIELAKETIKKDTPPGCKQKYIHAEDLKQQIENYTEELEFTPD